MNHKTTRLALPKGRMQSGVLELLTAAGVRVDLGERRYRPVISVPGFGAKLLKPQNVVEMLHAGSRDLGFAGADWVSELNGSLVELLDTGLDPVRVVAAAPTQIARTGLRAAGRLTVASEYARLSSRWIEDRGLDATLVRSYGATEVFPPEDADVIVDNTATGATLDANGLEIVDELMTSSTRLYANPRALENPPHRERIENLVVVLKSVVEARQRVMLEVNVDAARLDGLVAVLPCMRKPTVSRLHGEEGYAIRVAVLREALPGLIPRVKARGGTDLVVTTPGQIVA
ncbi:MAG: ATP phosphoribosyltransferase [Gemmatimonadota bacterium]|uniref:ATP phosphoribosyltransferase n=1 Tax=Candidatus Palauibacter scopulicola TaxID=3056741 RepID=UPI0023828BEA|nr:ATP phosphoribosyltransferase [Candidatus Palauibacter scopulicola]MDE2662662.1 ATP phosphoribosyltransferase [Candidatus Palauibacter scopulicola]